MLDKSIEFHSIIMRRLNNEPPRPTGSNNLPKGFTLRPYREGDELGWAEIEYSVLEFDSVEQALQCHKGYLGRIDELKQRQWFVEDENGKLAATATGWYQGDGDTRIPVVHALGCRPEYQGMGLGQAVAGKMIEAFYMLDKGRDIWLDTQTWSYKAIGLYMKLGFIPMKKAVFNEAKNEYELALPVLKTKMREDVYQKFVQLAENQ